MEEMGWLTVIFSLFLVVLAILWILLPFAVFGIKNRLDIIVKEANLANKRLKEIETKLSSTTRANPSPPPPRTKEVASSATMPDGGQSWPAR